VVKAFPSTKKLATIASRLFSIPVSNASVERNFSLQSKIHSKSRSRLSSKTIEKLVRLKWYLAEANDKTKMNDVTEEFYVDDVIILDDLNELTENPLENADNLSLDYRSEQLDSQRQEHDLDIDQIE